jgi:ABC-type Na+ transport system ATPase subunit NatA
MSNGEADTLPTLQTVLERINYVATMMQEFQTSVEGRLSIIERQLEQMDIRLDRIESVAHGAHSEVMNLRADFKEFKSQFNQPA